jgi:putative ABC transport system permease protein
MTGGIGRVVRSGVGRRRVQTVVMALTTLLAVTASVLAVGLLVASSEPFARAFARQNGAHLTAQFDPGKVTADQLAATANVAGVTATAGPFPTVELRPRTVTSRPSAPPPGMDLPAVTIVGRPDPGRLDTLDLLSGRWATGPGEMVWAGGDMPFQVGDEFAFPDAPGAPTLKLVGLARSVGRTATAWASPATVTALAGPEGGGYQMLYRLAKAGTDAEVTAGRQAIEAAVPPDAMQGAASYLLVKTDAERRAATFAPFIVAFGVLGLIMSVLIIGIVVSGAVGSATRRIGILKALGYTPAQVARAYVAQALLPATIGALLGIPLGNVAAVPILNDEGEAFGTGAVALDWWVSVVVPVVALVAVAVTAFVPALRAGRLHTVDALAVGRTPSLGRGRLARHVLGRLPLPRAMSLGLANPFTRPGRSATIAAAVALGALGVTFGVGLSLSIHGVQAALNKRDSGDVLVFLASGPGENAPQQPVNPGRPAPPKPDPAAVEAAIKAQPGTVRYFATARAEAAVAGITGRTQVVMYDGDASWGTYEMIEGRWFNGPGEAVVPSAFLGAAGVKIGDNLTLNGDGRSVTVRIVGEVLDLSSDGRAVILDSRSVADLALKPTMGGKEFHVDVADGTDLQAYTGALNGAVADKGGHAEVRIGEISTTVVAMDTLAGTLTLLLVAVAGLGVLNTVVLDTRERVHELGVFKALGMAPRQTVAMVLTSVAGIGLLAGLVGVPAGIAVHGWILPRMGHAAGTRFPQHILQVYDGPLLVALCLGGLLIAVGGALLPAGWAARTSTARALRTE